MQRNNAKKIKKQNAKKKNTQHNTFKFEKG